MVNRSGNFSILSIGSGFGIRSNRLLKYKVIRGRHTVNEMDALAT